mmetsp:Transcript_11107/g.23812  ORF Transcript_11107/g.23812 Transcript_11107/m.23812 type:complete len:89 (-) Transcript_11107:227-493(-)
MTRTAKFVADAASQLARRIPKREKPWSTAQIAVQKKRMQDNMASSISWLTNSWKTNERNPSEENVEVFLLLQGKYPRTLPSWVIVAPA